MSKHLWQRITSVSMLLMAAICMTPTQTATAQDSLPTLNTDQAGLYLKVSLSAPLKVSKLKPGDVVSGTVTRDVFAADHLTFKAGDPVHLTVDHLEKRKRTPNDHWPWVVKAFTPRHENYPVFKTAQVTEAGSDHSLNVSLISINRMREVRAQAKKSTTKASGNEPGAVEVGKTHEKNPATPTLILEASAPDVSVHSGEEDSNYGEAVQNTTLAAGTRCRILLLGGVSASKSKAGDVVQARLLEPVLLDSKVILPAGTLFQGKVLKKTPPRWLSRAGSLYMAFDSLTLPGGNRIPIAASLAGAELDAASHTRMDAEGRLRGERPGAAWMAINIGVTAGIAKEVDDGVQLIIEAIVSTATDASTAGTSRIIASAASGLYMVTRHGRDVVLPKLTEMQISLDRPLSVTKGPKIEAVVNTEGTE